MTRPAALLVRFDGQPVTVVGAGQVAAAKLATLLDAGAAVTVIAPDAVELVRTAAAEGRLDWQARPYRSGDLDGAVLAVAATAEAAVNARVAGDADACGLLCVRVDGGGTAAFAATVRRGPLTIAVATDGRAPALSAWLRAELEQRYGDEYGRLAELLGELRQDPEIRRRLAGLPAPERRRRWRSVMDADILTLLRNGQAHKAKEVASACLSSSTD